MRVGVEDLRRLGHEVDAREADDVGLRLRRRLRELERVADEVGDVLDLAVLVVVREEDRVALLLEALDLGLEVDFHRHATRCHHELAGVGRPVVVVAWRAREVVGHDHAGDFPDDGRIPEVPGRERKEHRLRQRVVGRPGRDPGEQWSPGLLGLALGEPWNSMRMVIWGPCPKMICSPQCGFSR